MRGFSITHPPIELLEPRRMLDGVAVHAEVNADNRHALYYGAGDGSGLTLAGYTVESGAGWDTLEQYDFTMPSDDYLYGVAWDWGGSLAMWVGAFELPTGLLVSSTHWQYIVEAATNQGNQPPAVGQLAAWIGSATSQQAWLTSDTWIPPDAAIWGGRGIAKEAQAIWTAENWFASHLNDPGGEEIEYVVFRAPLTSVGRVRVAGSDNPSDYDSITLSGDPADDDIRALVYRAEHGGYFTYQMAPALVHRLDVAMGNGDDDVSVNLSDGHVVFADGLTIDGGSGADALLVDQIATVESGELSANYLRVGTTEFDFANVESLALELNGGSVTFNSDANLAGVDLPLTVGGMGDVYYGSTQHLHQLSIEDSAVVEMDTGGDKVLFVEGLGIDSTAKLDLTDEDLIVDYDDSSPFGDIGNFIVTGYDGGDWLGNQLTSANAAASVSGGNLTALGYAEAAHLFTTFPGTFSGQTVDASSVLVKYTYAGDANLDGMVQMTDFAILGGNFNQSPTYWHQGDFNYDLWANIGDLALLAGNWNAGVGSPLGPMGGGENGVQEFLRLCAALGLSESDTQWLLSILNTGGQPQL